MDTLIYTLKKLHQTTNDKLFFKKKNDKLLIEIYVDYPSKLVTG